MIKKVYMIIDLQYGSTGKGLLAGYLAKQQCPDTVVTAWAANAGHTYISEDGRKFVHTMLANGIVSPNLKKVMIGPGSIIDTENLYKEMDKCKDLLGTVEIYIHENAAVITDEHRKEEDKSMVKIGSTKKGCGAAAIQRIKRDPDNMNTAEVMQWNNITFRKILRDFRNVSVVKNTTYQQLLDTSEIVAIEGAQGYSLSIYHGFYPYTTSRDVSTFQILADCGIPAGWFKYITIIGTARTFPIRVANRFNESGEQVGWSGPCYPDQEEITFESINQEIELTTVTKLPRRIFTFSVKQIAEAVRQNKVDKIFLNFANYCPSRDYLSTIIDNIEHVSIGGNVEWLGFGPCHDDIETKSSLIKEGYFNSEGVSYHE